MLGDREIKGLLTIIATWRLKRKDPYKCTLPSELQSLASFPGVWKRRREKIPVSHKFVSIPSHYHRRPVDGACAAEAGVLMQLMVPCRDTTSVSEQRDPFSYFSCQKPKPFVPVGSPLSVEA